MSHDLDRLTALGWNGPLESAFAGATRSGQRGLVVRGDGHVVTVLTDAGQRRVPLAAAVSGLPDDGAITTGDWLVVEDGSRHTSCHGEVR